MERLVLSNFGTVCRNEGRVENLSQVSIIKAAEAYPMLLWWKVERLLDVHARLSHNLVLSLTAYLNREQKEDDTIQRARIANLIQSI